MLNILDAKVYEEFTEDVIINGLNEAMGEFDRQELISEIIKVISNEDQNSSTKKSE